jgi:hypothetical protein
MSMTSKVNPTLRQEIVDYLAATGYGTSNQALVYTFGERYSLRTIQEATQKLTKDGTLLQKRESGLTFYTLNTTVPQTISVGAAV